MNPVERNRIGRRIRSLDDLARVANERGCVICPEVRCFSRRPLPAAFAMNFYGHILHRLISDGMFRYEPR